MSRKNCSHAVELFGFFLSPLIFWSLWLLGILLATPGANAQSGNNGSELRGTWLTTTGPDQIASGLNTAAVVSQLRGIGVNTVYVECWKNGYTQFPSSNLQSRIGFDRVPSLGSRNLLGEVIIQAHRQRQIAVAWFEYGFASQFLGSGIPPALNPLSSWAQENGWLLQDQSGRYANSSNGFAWMNPAVPEVRQLLIELVLEAISTHDLDGIQFDDRLSWPRDFGWDATTAAMYGAETGRNLPSNTNDANFRAWRQAKVTEFAQQLTSAVRAVRPDLHLSVSPSITGFSDNNYNARWTDWVSQNLFDEYIPQVYRDNFPSFLTTLQTNVNAFANSGGDLSQLVIGLRLNGTGPDTPLDVLQQQIDEVARAANGHLAGHSIFYGRGLIENAGSMTAFYNGWKDNPFFPSNHRPQPIEATFQAGKWNATILSPGYYRVVADTDGRWREVESAYFNSGDVMLEVGAASAVELLLDRRPYEPVGNLARIVDARLFHTSWSGPGSPVDLNKVLAKQGSDSGLLNYSHISNSIHGIEGILLTVENLPSQTDLSASDFIFQQSPQGAFDPLENPAVAWTLAADASVSVTGGQLSSILLTWPKGTITDRWLKLTVRANSKTGLAEPNIYYLGHLTGKSNNQFAPLVYSVQFADISSIRDFIGASSSASSISDIDKNGLVQFADIAAVRAAIGKSLSNISLP
jgi:uncharacterized lipoprotein YddW (UPF0748 family)